MERECTRCWRPFRPQDLGRAESKGMEAERKAAGLEGVRFLFYHCPACAMDDIFVDILPLPEESPEDYVARRSALEEMVRQLYDGSTETEAVVVEVSP